MTFLPRILLLAAAAYGAAAVAGSLALRAAASRLLRSPKSSRDLLFLRSLPSLFAGAVFLLAMAALVWYEPRESDEQIGVFIMSAAVLGVGAVIAAVASLVREALISVRATRGWLRAAEPVTLPGISAPAYAVNAVFPVIAVVGFFKPRLLIARLVLENCSPDELRLIAAHEAWHIARSDNVRRLVLAALPDVSRGPLRADALTDAWHSAAEDEADTAAAANGPGAAIELATALLKVARLAPAGQDPGLLPMSAFYRGGDISRRVRRLTQLGPEAAIQTSPPARTRYVVIAALLTALALLRPIHLLVEAIVAYLP